MIKIDVQNLNVHFDKNHALKDVNIKISDNEITAIIGPSGCGKSTFIRCINRMNDLIPSAKVTGGSWWMERTSMERVLTLPRSGRR